MAVVVANTVMENWFYGQFLCWRHAHKVEHHADENQLFWMTVPIAEFGSHEQA